jgi:hypothetical protein
LHPDGGPLRRQPLPNGQGAVVGILEAREALMRAAGIRVCHCRVNQAAGGEEVEGNHYFIVAYPVKGEPAGESGLNKGYRRGRKSQKWQQKKYKRNGGPGPRPAIGRRSVPRKGREKFAVLATFWYSGMWGWGVVRVLRQP